MILADTSVWIDHFRSEDQEMRQHLNRGQIAIHPFVIAELALGSLRERSKTLALLDGLPQVRVAQLNELRAAIEQRHLYGMGIGLIDAYLIASIWLDRSLALWTKDKRLRAISQNLGIDAGLP